MTLRDGRIAYAHSDWAGYSVFEEAFTMGHGAGTAVPTASVTQSNNRFLPPA